jgi:hypothetical protein
MCVYVCFYRDRTGTEVAIFSASLICACVNEARYDVMSVSWMLAACALPSAVGTGGKAASVSSIALPTASSAAPPFCKQ